MKRDRKRGFRGYDLLGKVLSLSLAAIILVMMELVSRVAFQQTHLDQILAVLERDPVLFRRNRSNLDTTFAGAPMFTEKRGLRVAAKGGKLSPRPRLGSRRIVCMGASPTFGWGVPYAVAYPGRLEQLLIQNGIDSEVINAGMIGNSSHQGKMLLKYELFDLSPSLITVAYVINDIDKYRFFRSNGQPDRLLDRENGCLTSLMNIVDRSFFVRLYGKMIGRVVGWRGAVEGRPLELYRPLSVRVPPEDYRANLEEIVRTAGERGVRVVYVKMPVNLPSALDPPRAEAEEAQRLCGQGVALAEKGECEAALPLLEKAVALNGNLSEAHYFIGVCQRRRGQDDRARQAFDRAMKSEAYRCGRDGLRYNQIMEEVAGELGIDLVDVAAAFRETSGEYLFLDPDHDPIHPNARGHEIIAGRLFQTLAKRPQLATCLPSGKAIEAESVR